MLNVFQIFLLFFWNFQKSSEKLEIIGKFPDVIGNVRNGSQELKSFGSREVLKRTPVNCCAQITKGK